MEPIIVECRFLKAKNLPFKAVMIWPFILIDKKNNRKILLMHERIHFKQAIELLILPFYVIYTLHYLWGLILFLNHNQAYLNVIFEREAYKCAHNPNYLKTRKPYAWLR
tara:strand:+ start:759 stop:1085 length:327 start_codon:yes stop_codon:yes gene_type:complete